MANTWWCGRATSTTLWPVKKRFSASLGHVSVANYQTLRDDNGPRHAIDSRLRMGSSVDSEGNAAQSLGADGDDTQNTDDENGLVNAAVDLALVVGQAPSVRVRATNTTGSAAQLFGWIDYNNDGIFSNSTERASVNVPNGSSNVQFTLAFPAVPAGSAGNRFARFRLATSGAANSTGFAADGEVEDYAVTIANPAPPPAALETEEEESVSAASGSISTSPASPTANQHEIYGGALLAVVEEFSIKSKRGR